MIEMHLLCQSVRLDTGMQIEARKPRLQRRQHMQIFIGGTSSTSMRTQLSGRHVRCQFLVGMKQGGLR